MRLRNKLLTVIFVFAFFFDLNGQNTILNNDILVKLNKNYGVFSRAEIPQLERAEEKIGVACAEMPPDNKIVIDRELVRCLRGKDSLNALAFVLGHELAHFYYHKSNPNGNPKKTNFACYSNFDNTNQGLEENCDVMGAFMAYLAGYKINDVLPEFIEKLYKNYPLDASKMKCYPTLEERKATAKVVQAKVNRLIQIYEAANYMLVLNKPNLSATCYKEILKEYKGSEMYNNLGVSYLYSVLYSGNDYNGTWIYPIQVNMMTRLQRAETDSRSVNNLNQEQRKLLDTSIVYFKKALEQNDTSFAARVNLICAYLTKGDINTAQSNLVFINQNDAKIVLNGLIKIEKKDTVQAINEWSKSLHSDYWRNIVAQNIKIKDNNIKPESCLVEIDPKQDNRYINNKSIECDTINGIEHHFGNATLKVDTLNRSFCFSQLGEGKIVVILHQGKTDQFNNDIKYCPTFGLEKGELLIRKNSKTFYKVNAEGLVEYWGQYKK